MNARKIDKDKAIAGYEQAIALWIFSGNQGWSIFNVMLVCNSIIIATIGITIKTANLKAFSLCLVVIGVGLCFFWFFLTKRNTAYSRYYIMSAREIEELYLSDVITTVSRGNSFVEGKPIFIKLNGKSKKMRIGSLSQITSASSTGYVIIILFTLFYFVAFYFIFSNGDFV